MCRLAGPKRASQKYLGDFPGFAKITLDHSINVQVYSMPGSTGDDSPDIHRRNIFSEDLGRNVWNTLRQTLSATVSGETLSKSTLIKESYPEGIFMLHIRIENEVMTLKTTLGYNQ